jgi:predicted  nucleic acid-binding Zn-ribbon protein
MEQTIEQKLKALYDLQIIHTKIDKIRQVRGELPMEVADLEDDVAGLETRIQKIKNELDDLEDEIVTRKNLIKDSQANIKKYETQLNEVKNNREYDAISKEIEIQGLDIQVSEKKIREFGFEIASKTGIYEKAQADLDARRSDLDAKKDELGTITIQRDSCSGCFNQIPPQRQSDIRQRKKIIVCEHCGRILVDELMALEEENV